MHVLSAVNPRRPPVTDRDRNGSRSQPLPHSLDSITTVRRLVAFYVDEHNRVLPHSAFRGQTPDEMYFGTGGAIGADLTARAAAARRARLEANRSASCATCPSVDAAA